MSVPVVIAIIAGGVSLIVGVLNAMTSRSQQKRITAIETAKLDLARTESVTKARLDYEYQARRRLYELWEPAFFQLVERAMFAIGRMHRLADGTTWHELALAEPNAPTDSRPTLPLGKYELLANLYGIYAPLVHIRAMSRTLTDFDLGLEPRIRFQQFVASCAYRVLQDDALLAAAEPSISYTPFAAGWRSLRESAPQQYWWQGLTMGRLENILDVLTDDGDAARPISFGRFERLYLAALEGTDDALKKDLAAAANAMFCFRPGDRPVYCRVLSAQARLYNVLVRSRRTNFRVPTDESAWMALLEMNDAPFVDIAADSPYGLDGSAVARATNNYLWRNVVARWDEANA